MTESDAEALAALLEVAFPLHAVVDLAGFVQHASAHAVEYLQVRSGGSIFRAFNLGSRVTMGRLEEGLEAEHASWPEIDFHLQAIDLADGRFVVVIHLVRGHLDEAETLAKAVGSPAFDRTDELLKAKAHIESARSELYRELRKNKVELEKAQREVRALRQELQMARQHARELSVDNTNVSTQKLQILGQLAGSITHDFNNLLVAILGHAQHGLEESDDSGAKQALLGIQDAAERAAALTARILTFSSPTGLSDGRVDAAKELLAIEDLLRRLLQESVSLEVFIRVEHAWIPLERSQLEQCLVNLSVNARDAMPNGGQLTMSIARRHVGKPMADSLGLKPGAYICITVRDDGVGMPKDVIRKIWNPFFTTKGPGLGTGLGLSTVAGLIQGAGGAVHVDSTEGVGTAFTLWLPEAQPPQGAAEAPSTRLTAAPEGKVILLVDDEAQVRRVVARSLQKEGWTIVEASNVEEAFARMPSREDLAIVVTDHHMPGTSGIAIVDWLERERPGTPCLLMSGYAEDVELREGARMGRFRLLRKPFDRKKLVDALNRSIARSRQRGLDGDVMEPVTDPSWAEEPPG